MITCKWFGFREIAACRVELMTREVEKRLWGRVPGGTFDREAGARDVSCHSGSEGGPPCELRQLNVGC
jgi:hypothetical protein